MDVVASSQPGFERNTARDIEAGAPRFEFRVWGEPVADAAQRLRSRSAPLETRKAVDTYFVSTATIDANPKARIDMLDIKTLVAVRDGCQQWAVHLKAPFPVPAPLLATELFAPLRVQPPALDRDEYSLEQLVQELVDPHPDMAAVAVTKHREIHSAGGCLAEVSEVSFADRTLPTLAVESADLDAVTDLRAALGLVAHDNVSYPSMIRTALGGRFALESE